MLRLDRRGALAAGLVLAVWLSGCSGGGVDHDDRDEPGPLDSPQAVVQRLATGPLSEFFAPPVARAKSSVTAEPSAAWPRSMAKVLLACPDGGTREEFDFDTGDLGSPFTLETFLIEDTWYDDCEETFDDGTVWRQSGLESYGCPLSDSDEFPCSDSGNVEIYTRWLGSSTSPFEDAVSLVTEAGNELQYLVTRPGYRFHSETVYDFGGFADRTRRETHTFSPSVGTVSVNGAVPRSFESSLGLAGEPLVRVRLFMPDGSVRLTVDGPASLSGTGCQLGTFDVHTVQPIQYFEDTSGAVTDVFAGRIEVIQDGQVAIADITGDGSLRITDGRGRTRTYGSVQEVRADLGSCRDFAAQ